MVFLGIALLIFLPFNWLSVRQLVRIHPRRKRWIATAAILGNVMWVFLPWLRTSTPLTRFARAVFGPLWLGWTCFAILYAAFVVLVLVAWIPFARRTKLDAFARWPSRVFLAILGIGFAIGFYQALVPLRIERVSLRVPGLARPARLVLMGDLHVGMFTRPSRLDEIFTTAGSLQPDAVLIAGDLIDDDPHYVPKLVAGTRTLPKDIPLYAVPGNHEMYGDPLSVIAQLRGTRIRLLVNEGVAVQSVWIAGVSDPAAQLQPLKPDLAKALQGRPPNLVPIALAHQPRILDTARRLHVPVALCAHSHGGQLGIRRLHWSLAGVFLRYHMGLYDVPPTKLYVNTGTGYWVLPFRLGMTPEITVIELRP